MTDPANKKEMVNIANGERASWEALLRQVGVDRMELRGVCGEWSVKDIIAHLTAWERRALAGLRAAQEGVWPQPPEWPVNLGEEGTTAWIFAAHRGRQLQDVLNESRTVFDELIQAFSPLTDQDLTEPGRFEWTQGRSLQALIRENSSEHYQDHSRGVRAWLGQRRSG